MPDHLSVLPQPLVGRLCIIGLGLIGSSLARAVRATHAAGTIIAADRAAEVRERVKILNLVDEVYESARDAVRHADLVIFCIPVGSYASVMQDMAGALKPGAIISDVGSVKACVMAQITPFLPKDVQLVPAHPVAGTEYSGPDAGFATLFQNRWSILTPPESTAPEAVQLVQKLWQAFGSNVEIMSAEHHDLVLAITSHVPHLIAYNIVGTAADLETVTQSEVVKFSAGGFRDFTRIAASDPVMWRDIFLNNKPAVLEMLGRFNEDLAALTRAIRWDDGDALLKLFTRTRAIRRGVIDEGQTG
jgi:cyclohexadieny/prephenate dehydrogenase